jgi:hypothetical protein
MRDLELIEAYACALEEALVRAGRPAQPLVDETIAHLVEDAARIARAEDCSDEEAARRAIARFGDVSTVVRASRRYGRTLAASVVRISSLVLLAALAWVAFEMIVDFSDPICAVRRVVQTADFLLLGELALTTVFLLRAVAGRPASRVLPLVLLLNGAFVAALFVRDLASDSAQGVPVLRILLDTDALTYLVIIQAAAGLRVLAVRRTADGSLVTR